MPKKSAVLLLPVVGVPHLLSTVIECVDRSCARRRDERAFLDALTERSVLGAALVSPQIISTAGELDPGAFGEHRHGLVWESILRLHSAGTTPDLVTVKDDLDKRGTWRGSAVPR